jgi:hypothetical protein
VIFFLSSWWCIFVFVAGYNCSHEMVPVHILIVPKDVIDRNIENGNYKPS